jgi:hypothetical protein
MPIAIASLGSLWLRAGVETKQRKFRAMSKSKHVHTLSVSSFKLQFSEGATEMHSAEASTT